MREDDATRSAGLPRRYADYLEGIEPDPDDYAREVARAVDQLDPADRGAVFVNWIAREENRWTASWQRGDEHRSVDGTQDEVISWALAQDASNYWIFSSVADDFVPLKP